MTNASASGMSGQNWNNGSLLRHVSMCGATEHIQVHHIRALKDLKKYDGREKPAWVQINGGSPAQDAGPLSLVSSRRPCRTPDETTLVTFIKIARC
ncbi:hypothetical protein [Dictyobacter kobayashii]|uniref:hypothetical protein n=1 Tax=Dictyobacter kobayashii TaxID=2014872 RepID=UPI001FE99933|nr:hypothetical protein [Dictyobacter kobayashii]